MADAGGHILFIGGLGTIGRVVVAGLRKSGHAVTVADFSDAAPVPIDIRDKASILAALDRAEADAKPLTAAVNCAYPRNRNYGRAVEDVAFEDFSENLSWHLGGFFVVMQQVCQHFAAREEGGAMINFASIYGMMAPRFEVYDGTPMTMPVEYAAIKSATLHLSRYFAQHYKKSGVRVNCISPGGVEDGQPEAFLEAYRRFAGRKGMLDAADLTDTVAFLAGPGGRWITGQNIVVDDGFSL